MGRSQGYEKGIMMNHTYGWMGGEMWVWTVVGILLVVLLVVVSNKLPKKQFSDRRCCEVTC
jgi:hypothetical protein